MNYLIESTVRQLFYFKDVIHPVPFAMRVSTLCVARSRSNLGHCIFEVTFIITDQMPAKTKVWVNDFSASRY